MIIKNNLESNIEKIEREREGDYMGHKTDIQPVVLAS